MNDIKINNQYVTFCGKKQDLSDKFDNPVRRFPVSPGNLLYAAAPRNRRPPWSLFGISPGDGTGS